MDKALKKIQADIDKLEAKKAKLIRDKAIPDIIAKMRAVGVTPKDIAEHWGTVAAKRARSVSGKATAKTGKTSRPPKYRDPASGETWSGMGKRPFWLRDAEDAGRSREEFLIAAAHE
ncbi:H-NS histone family protein [Achromobacter anxifer]|uniref:H-NS histone family protein n=1 Tax=Achromobacter anxifer TaxID=1287737 RepID=UPI0023F6A48E|nr:H-NS histone family protein [Achromobacter anxifer]MDF8364712.1 H-NS histone family protein [Achromobacter anxifer]